MQSVINFFKWIPCIPRRICTLGSLPVFLNEQQEDLLILFASLLCGSSTWHVVWQLFMCCQLQHVFYFDTGTRATGVTDSAI